MYTASFVCNIAERISHYASLARVYTRGPTCVRMNGGGRQQKYLVHDKCPDAHHGATISRRVPQNRATIRPLVTIMLKCNLLITAAAPSRSLISPICTAVGERKQNGNERPVPPGRMIRDKEGGIGDAKGMAKRDTERDQWRRRWGRGGRRERERGRTMVAETGDTKRNKFRNR